VQPSSTSFVSSFDHQGQWRARLGQQLSALERYLAEHDLADAETRAPLLALSERVSHEKLVVAFVAEFSRGKSELINAIFFSDFGRRVLPATPGRTTMCPVELSYEAGAAPALALLPIETRLESTPLSELRGRASLWTLMPLDVSNADHLSATLAEVTRTQWVSVERAAELGFVDTDRPQDMPVRNEAGQLEVPKWRHALINYPHPLLKQGLVVLDTPGLNAVGVEPELTLSLLPSAHATVFVLGADTGVTQSDMNLWRDHLCTQVATRYVVLNKIDILQDPLASPEVVARQIEQQQHTVTRLLDLAPDRVFALSAREALAARIQSDPEALRASRIEALEQAFTEHLLPQRREVVTQALNAGLQGVEREVGRRLSDQRRHLADQIAELRGLRGKSRAKVRMLIRRLEEESQEFEQCTSKLQALRAVHARMGKDAVLNLSNDRVREVVDTLSKALEASVLNLGTKKAFAQMCADVRAHVKAAEVRSGEISEMLQASFDRLNAEFGFALALVSAPALQRVHDEVTTIERNYAKYLGISQAIKMGQPRFIEHFRRMLLSKLRVLFESASAEFDIWSKAVSAQIDAQLKERRKSFRNRKEALERIESATDELEERLAELDSQDERLQQFSQRIHQALGNLRVLAQPPA
jgi:hypothetical protein